MFFISVIIDWFVFSLMFPKSLKVKSIFFFRLFLCMFFHTIRFFVLIYIFIFICHQYVPYLHNLNGSLFCILNKKFIHTYVCVCMYMTNNLHVQVIILCFRGWIIFSNRQLYLWSALYGYGKLFVSSPKHFKVLSHSFICVFHSLLGILYLPLVPSEVPSPL